MDLEFSELRFDGIGRETSTPDAMWGNLELRFKDTLSDRHVGVQLALVLPKGPNVTIAELQNAARDNAMTILRAALACLEENGVAELERMTPERREKHLGEYLSS